MALIGAGRANEFTIELGRRLATAAGLAAKQRRVARVAFVARADGPAKLDARQLAQAIAEGLTLAEFNVGSYKTGDPPPGAAPAWTIVSPGAAGRRCERGRRRAGASSASAATWRASSRTSRATR